MATEHDQGQIPHRARPAQVLLLAALLLCAAWALWHARRAFIRSWFERGPVRAPLLRGRPAARGPLRPVRVVLIDGLSQRIGSRLLALQQICREGLDLRLDTGFPTVSLPVQHVLWTGAWQGQSGVLFETGALDRPVLQALTDLVQRRGGRSLAVAEGHAEIASSFGFSQVTGPAPGEPWLTPLSLQQEALAAVQSGAELVLVHLLSVDRAGHGHGSSHPRYLEAAREADRLVQGIWQVRQPGWTLLVLSDHGHLAAPPGGHGGAEPEVRWVRACLAGPGIPSGRRAVAAMPDLTRILAHGLNVDRPSACVGRPLKSVLQRPGGAPARGGEPALPGAAPWSVLWLGLALLIWRLGGGGKRSAAATLPWGLALSVLLVLAWQGPPSLSRGYVFGSWPLPVLACGLPALLLPGLQLQVLLRRGQRGPRAVLLLALVSLLPVLVLVGSTGWPFRIPPLTPYLSAWASLLLLLCALSFTGLAAWTLLLGSISPARPGPAPSGPGG